MAKKLLLLAACALLNYQLFSQQIGIRTVVHVLYKDASSNLPDTKVLSIIDSINRGFSKTLPATFTRATPIFDTLWANTDIKLCLADHTPTGAATNGITHTVIPDSLADDANAAIYIDWNRDNYLNIYIAPVHYEPGYNFFVLGGWASVAGLGGATTYAVTVASNIIPNTVSAALAHEIGHVFGLQHTDGDTIGDLPKGAYHPLVTVSGVGYPASCSSTLQSMNSTTADGAF